MLKGVITNILFAAILILCGGCSNNTTEIVIVSTNDVHASFEQMPKVMTIVKGLRAEYDNVLVFDAGDHCTGNPFVDMADPQGEPIHHLINMIGYDYGAVGNHEFDYKQEGLSRGIKDMGLTTLCANANFEGTILEGQIKPYEIIEVGGVRTAILGLIQLGTGGIPSAMPDNMRGIEFTDGVAKSQEYKFLRDSADLVIALTHLGFRDDSLMVCQNDMFDLVVGGHSHTYLPEGRVINGTLVTQSGSKLRGVGVTKIKMEGDEVVSVTNKVVDLADVESDSIAMAYVASCKKDSPLNAPIGKLDRTLKRVGLLNMTTDVMRERSGADIAIQNSGSIRIDSLAEGEVVISQIYALEPFRNHIVVEQITLAGIKEMIMNKFNSEGGESHSVDLSTSGMSYTIFIGKDGDATAVECYDTQGRKMAEGSYTMATSNYVNSAYNYSGQGKAKAIEGRVVIADAVAERIIRDRVFCGDNERRVRIEKIK